MNKKRKGWIQCPDGEWYKKGKKEDLFEPIRFSFFEQRAKRVEEEFKKNGFDGWLRDFSWSYLADALPTEDEPKDDDEG